MQFGLIGEHLAHSFSKEIHSRLGQYPYDLLELAPDAVTAFMTARQFAGINVTIPYKQTVIPFLKDIDPVAKEIDAVNTVLNKNGELYGYNTDFGGLTALIQKAGISLENKKVLILGTGGTSRTALAVAHSLGAKETYRVSRSKGKDVLTYGEVMESHTDADILINTTPCGMFGNQQGMPIDPDLFPRLSGVVDAIYNPLRTLLVQKASEKGIPATGGLFMLVMQGVLASQLFLDVTYPQEITENIYRDIEISKENIVLTGMPSCGKSTVGKRLSETLNRPFIDTDAEIEKKAGMTISDIFATQGEQAFRDLETAVIKEVAAETGVVIATGGGAVLRQENVRALRSNGKLFFLNRPLHLLIPTDDRPLAGSKQAIEKRFAERFSIYCDTADSIIDGSGCPETVTDLVKKEFLK
jgi:shikimate dehydrogenase